MLTIKDINHILYDLTLGRCNWSLQTQLLLTKENIDQLLTILNIKCSWVHTVEDFSHAYNRDYITPDIAIHNDDDSQFYLFCDHKLFDQLCDKIPDLTITHETIIDGSYKAIEHNHLRLFTLLWPNVHHDFKNLLSRAVAQNRIDFVSIILTRENITIDDCLYTAIAYNYVDMFKFLLPYNHTNLKKEASYAAIVGQLEILKFLIKFADIQKCVKFAIRDNHVEMVDYLVNLNRRPINAYLKYATYCGNIHIVRMLINYGATNFKGCRLMAQKQKHPSLILLFEEKLNP